MNGSPCGGMADTADSKSAIRRYVRVQVPPRAPFQFSKLKSIVKILRCAALGHPIAVCISLLVTLFVQTRSAPCNILNTLLDFYFNQQQSAKL